MLIAVLLITSFFGIQASFNDFWNSDQVRCASSFISCAGALIGLISTIYVAWENIHLLSETRLMKKYGYLYNFSLEQLLALAQEEEQNRSEEYFYRNLYTNRLQHSYKE